MLITAKIFKLVRVLKTDLFFYSKRKDPFKKITEVRLIVLKNPHTKAGGETGARKVFSTAYANLPPRHFPN